MRKINTWVRCYYFVRGIKRRILSPPSLNIAILRLNPDQSGDMESLHDEMQRLRISSKLPCSNDKNGRSCKNVGTLACTKCLIVAYCSRHCRKAHWSIHHVDCQSPFMKETWKPGWVTDSRAPTFARMDVVFLFIGKTKDFWGNVPGVDMLQLARNEGTDYRGPLRMLFAASGDMRNVILSVASLPQSYHGPLNVVMNDKKIDIVARNIIFLLIFFVEVDADVAADCVLHVWYSALITKSCHKILLKKVKPMVQNVCDRIAYKYGSTLFGKTWRFGQNSLRLVLSRDNWFALLGYFDIAKHLNNNNVQLSRRRIVYAPESVDYADRALCLQTPTGRLAVSKFRKDGLLLPFGHPREAFTLPNPTMFDETGQWPMLCNTDPRSGWSMKSFLDLNIGPAKNDVFGKLHHYLKHLFGCFHRQLRSEVPIEFELLHLNAFDLPQSLHPKRFDRIDVGNISDDCYLGPQVTLSRLSPLLQPLSTNPHATLIALFMDAVPEMRTRVLEASPPFVSAALAVTELENAEKHMSGSATNYRDPSHPNYYKLMLGGVLFRDTELYFDHYMLMNGFPQLADSVGLEMKAAHTIVEAWPTKIFVGAGPATPQAKEEFSRSLSSYHTGQERFVEWKCKVEGTQTGNSCEIL
ncbi:hypothetical protein GGS21DRAFT_491683 [Xylaria nigripes]|nr:hypothetical protein GGS21DRAFT_491683 [Xylaria nigripes]